MDAFKMYDVPCIPALLIHECVYLLWGLINSYFLSLHTALHLIGTQNTRFNI